MNTLVAQPYHQQPSGKHTRPGQDRQYDVVILGTGIAGTMLGAILARNGVRVLLIDAGSHPRFAIGESTIPHTSRMMEILSDRFDVPEIKLLATFASIRQHITGSCGIKQNFGFVYHREGQTPVSGEATQLVIPGELISYESHLFRQDIDAYMLHVAARYGAHVRQQTMINAVEIDEKGVTMRSTSGEEFTSRYLVDGSGFRSPLAHKFGLREQPSRLKTQSRTLFTHMIGVKHYDDCISAGNGHHNPSPWSAGTLHHLFKGGWMWVIPFNNHKDSTNPLCSVGLSLNLRLHPKNGIPAEQEFMQFIANYPDLAEQFANAKAVRDWVATDRLQYSSTACVGDRFCMMSHATGFLDALFSRGLANTSDVVYLLGDLLLQAVEDDDFSAQRFQSLERLQQGLINYNDQLVHCAYISFADFELWKAWFKVWALGVGYGELRLIMAHMRFAETEDPLVLRNLLRSPHPGLLFPLDEAYKQLWDASVAHVEAFDAGQMTAQEAAGRIRAHLDKVDFGPPFFNISDPELRYIQFPAPHTMLQNSIAWLGSAPSSDIRTFHVQGIVSMVRRLSKGQKL